MRVPKQRPMLLLPSHPKKEAGWVSGQDIPLPTHRATDAPIDLPTHRPTDPPTERATDALTDTVLTLCCWPGAT